jgi:hypothetical protein
MNLNDRFGRSVSINADGTCIAAASSFYHGSFRGIVRTFELVENKWVVIGDLEGSKKSD